MASLFYKLLEIGLNKAIKPYLVTDGIYSDVTVEVSILDAHALRPQSRRGSTHPPTLNPGELRSDARGRGVFVGIDMARAWGLCVAGRPGNLVGPRGVPGSFK